MKNQLQIIKSLSLKKIINYFWLVFSYRISILLKKSFHKGNPAFLTIEPTNICNLKCPECPSGSDILTRPKGKMDLALFKKIISENYKTLIYLNLYFQGEPFLNSELFKMISFAKEKVIYTEISTNGHFLDEDNCTKIIKSGLDSIIISLDGLDKETYDKYRKNGDFDKVTTGINNLVKIKNKLNSKLPYIKLQFLVLKHNEHQIKKLKTTFKKLKADKLIIKSAQIYNFENAIDILPVNSKFSRYKFDKGGKFVIKYKLKNKCFKIWSSCVITWDGIIVPCCFDKNADFKLGDIYQNSLSSVWKSSTFNDFRLKLLENRREIDICRNCSE